LILNMGCGRGLPSHKFIWLGDVRIDVRKARNVTIVADAHHLPFRAETFNIIIAFEVCEHFLSPSQALTEMRRVLKSNGKIIISIPNVWRVGRIVTWLLKRMDSLKSDSVTYHRQIWDVYELNNLLRQLELKIANIYWKDRGKQSIKRRILTHFLPPEISESHLFVEIIKN